MSQLRKFTEATFQDAVLALKSGKTYGEVAREYGVGVTGFRELVKRRGIDIAPRKRQSAPLCLPMRDTDLAYLAGIIDGEGSISGTMRYGAMRYTVCVYSTDKPLIDWLMTIGGVMHVRTFTDPAIVSKRTQYGWAMQRRADVLCLLVALLPYLRIKRNKAQDVISYIGSRLPVDNDG